jgi:2-hydroxy-3-oxopropionate reductase
MGARIVRRLLALSLKISVWNRTRAKADELAPVGASVYDSPADAVREATVVIICLHDGAAVSEVLFESGVATALRPGTLVIDMSSIQPELARANARRLRNRSVGYVDAPGTGGVVGAEAGTLLIMAGGDAADIERASRTLSILGRVVAVGESGAGQVAKIAHQILMGAIAGGLAEAILIAEANHIEAERIVGTLQRGLVHSRALELYAGRVLSRDFRHRGAGASIQLKDLESALAEGTLAGLDLPVSRLLHGLYEELLSEFGDLDKSAIYLSLAKHGTRKPEGAPKKGGRR